MTTEGARWWRDAVGYEVYIRSFADGDGDGIGDLPGLIDRLEHLAWLGIDVVWITPFYPSPMADYGYDVADYCDVNPLFGTLDDFDQLIEKADGLGLRVVIDLVPNHTSDQHPWFRAARSSRDDPHHDYYHWRDPDPSGAPPNNWVSYFGGPAWSTDEVSGQQYLHLFLPEQPDLNWENPAVVAEFDTILRFWLDRGVAGFRIDVAQAMGKDPELRSNPEHYPIDHTESRWIQWAAFDHRHDILQPSTLDVFRRWRSIVEEYGAVLIGETYVLEAEELAALVPGDGLHVGFWFKPMHLEWDAARIAAAVRGPLDAGVDTVGWVLSSHDEPRPSTRFGGGATGTARALAFSTLLQCLPGMPFLYQGEELGIENGMVPPEAKADPVGGDDPAEGRDGCRTPMPWSIEPGRGFSPSGRSWLPSSHDTPDQTVEGQRADPRSPLHRVRRLLEVRREIPADAPVEWLDHGDIVHLRRGAWDVVVNAGDDDEVLADDGTVVFSSLDTDPSPTPTVVRPNEAVVIRRG